MNTYSPDNSAILDANGKPWPVETPHLLPLPEGISATYFKGVASDFSSIAFGSSGAEWRVYRTAGRDTHWLARRPLPPVPKVKTQRELDEEAFAAYWAQDYSPQRIVMGHEDTWRAALAYARKPVGKDA